MNHLCNYNRCYKKAPWTQLRWFSMKTHLNTSMEDSSPSTMMRPRLHLLIDNVCFYVYFSSLKYSHSRVFQCTWYTFRAKHIVPNRLKTRWKSFHCASPWRRASWKFSPWAILMVSLILIATSTLPSTSLHKLTAYLSLVVYDSEEVEVECGEECILAGHCQCSKCSKCK